MTGNDTDTTIEEVQFEGLSVPGADLRPYLVLLTDIPLIGLCAWIWSDDTQKDMQIPFTLLTVAVLCSSMFVFRMIKARRSGHRWIKISETGIEGRTPTNIHLAWDEILSASGCPAILSAREATDLLDQPWTILLTDRNGRQQTISDKMFGVSAQPGFTLAQALRTKGFLPEN
jgi:hypothetical protein